MYLIQTIYLPEYQETPPEVTHSNYLSQETTLLQQDIISLTQE